jgi:pimeloyl-ACP methyl ester carboxylesterase
MKRLLCLVSLAACATAPPATKPTAHESKYVVVNGIKTYYEVRGDGPPLLLLHGGTGGIESMDKQLAFFPAHYRVIAPERMGHGRTADVPDREFHYHQMAEDTVAFMQAIGVDAADMIGWSDGGIVGLDIALNHPERVKRLAISGANFRVDGVAPPALAWLRQSKAEEWPDWIRDEYKRLSPDGPAHWPIFFERMKKMFMSEPDYTVAQLNAIKVPVLVMGGDNDLVRPAHLVELAGAIPGAELCIYPGAGHGWPRGKPDQFNAIVLAFLQKKAKPASAGD